MQYILTEEEYKSLVPKNQVEELEEKIEKLNGIVLNATEFYCCRTTDRMLSYCDDCPITFSCKKPKRYSK